MTMNKGIQIQEFYDHVKKDPDAVVMDVGEANPVIISETDYLCKMVDGSTRLKTLYCTFEYVKKHLKELKGCDCEACRSAVASYRVNKKTIRALESGATPAQIDALVPNDWILDMPH
jgi:hypothetical protein